MNKQCESRAKSESFDHNLFYINNINYFKTFDCSVSLIFPDKLLLM